MHIDQWLSSISPELVYLAEGLVIGCESLGIPLPGEIILVSSALLASRGVVNPWLVFTAAAVGASVGDSIGYAIGRKYGRELFEWLGRRFPRHLGPKQLLKAEKSFIKWGVWAVFFGRFIALLRIFAGPLAGVLQMRYWKFAIANVCGALLWAGVTTAFIYYVGIAAERWLKGFSWLGLAVMIAISLVSFTWIRRKSHAREDEELVTVE